MPPEPTPCLASRLSRRRLLEAAGIAGIVIPLDTFASPDQVHDLRGKVTINNPPATPKSDIAMGAVFGRGRSSRIVAANATIFETHTDEEMDILEKRVGRRSPLVVPR